MSDIRIQPEPVAIVRVFLVYAIALFTIGILAWLLTGGGTEIFEPKSYLHSYMNDASGLIVTAAVQLNGIQIGKITDVKLSGLSDPKKIVWVEMKVKSRYLPAIPVDSTVAITADNLLGDKYLNITTGQRSESVQPGAELRSVLPIADQFNSADLVSAMKDMLTRVDASLQQIEDPNTTMGKFVLTEEFYERARTYIVSIQTAIDEVSHPKSDIGKMLFTDELYERIRGPIIGLDKTLADLQAGEGTYGHMLASGEQYDQFHKQLSGIRQSFADINAGKGSLGQWTQSDVNYRQLERLLRTMEKTVDVVKAGEGQLGAFLADSQLYESLTGSSGELQQMVGDFRRNPRKYLRMKVF